MKRVIDHAKEFVRTIGMTSFTGYTSCTTIASILLCEQSNGNQMNLSDDHGHVCKELFRLVIEELLHLLPPEDALRGFPSLEEGIVRTNVLRDTETFRFGKVLC